MLGDVLGLELGELEGEFDIERLLDGEVEGDVEIEVASSAV